LAERKKFLRISPRADGQFTNYVIRNNKAMRHAPFEQIREGTQYKQVSLQATTLPGDLSLLWFICTSLKEVIRKRGKVPNNIGVQERQPEMESRQETSNRPTNGSALHTLDLQLHDEADVI
jgi:hypothetical protein